MNLSIVASNIIISDGDLHEIFHSVVTKKENKKIPNKKKIYILLIAK